MGENLALESLGCDVAVDRIRERFGTVAVTPASSLVAPPLRRR